jgi:chemotaxis protein methyltransferase CheR
MLTKDDHEREAWFFRDAVCMRMLREEVLPELLKRAASTRTVRVWNPGCFAGEDTYTLAILLSELVPTDQDWFVSLVGTDADLAAITRARKAIYARSSLRGVDQAQRAQYFHELEGEQFQLKRKYQLDVTFQVHNLADITRPPPPPGRFDLVFTRNLSSLALESHSEVSAKISAALAPEGTWIAGGMDATPSRGFATRAFLGRERRPLSARKAEELPAEPTRRSPVPKPDSSPAQAPRPGRSPKSDPGLSEPRRPEPVLGAEPSREEFAELRRLADSGQDAAAIAAASALVQRYPNAAEPYQVRAMLRGVGGDHRGAVEDWRRVLYLDPTNLHARFRLGLALARCGDRAGARVALNALITMPVLDETAAEPLRAAATRHLTLLNQDDSHE